VFVALCLIAAMLPASVQAKDQPTKFYWSAGEDFITKEKGERFLTIFPSYFNGYNSVWGEGWADMTQRIQAAKQIDPTYRIGYYTTWGFHVRDRHDLLTTMMDGKKGDSLPMEDLYGRTHVPCFGNQKLIDSFEPLAKTLQQTGFTRFLIGDSSFPISPEYVPGGYAEDDIQSYRKFLEGKDEGLEFHTGSGYARMHFWDYFRRYYGFKLSPTDLGFANWQEYTPPVNLTPDPEGGAANKRILLHYALIRYYFLWFNAQVGRTLNAHGISLENIPIHEFPIHGIDELWLILCRGNDNLLVERFDQAAMVYFYDVASDEINHRFSYYGRMKAAGSPGHEFSVMGELGQWGGMAGCSYWAPGFAFISYYDLAANQHFSEVHHDFLEQASPGKNRRYDLTQPEELTTQANPMEWFRYLRLLMAGEGVQSAELDQASKPARNRILYIGDRPLFRRVWHLAHPPEGVQNYSGNNIGYLSTILLDSGIPFDFADTSLEQTNTSNYDVIIYNAIDLPDGLMAKLGKWLKGSPKHLLITHGSLPTHRINSPKWVAGRFWTEDPSTELNEIIDPAAAGAIGLNKITLGGLLNTGNQYFRIQSDLPKKVLVGSDAKPLVTELGAKQDGKVAYIHYDCGRVKNTIDDTRILLALLAQAGISPLNNNNSGCSVHSYASKTVPGSIFVIRNKSALFDRLKAGNKSYYAGYYPDLMTNVTLYLPKGDYTGYQFLNNKIFAAKSTANGLQLKIHNQAGEIVILTPKGKPSTLISIWKTRRKKYETYLNMSSVSLYNSFWNNAGKQTE